MKTTTSRFIAISSKIQKEHIQLIIMTLTVLMLVLGVGAPTDAGGIGH